MMRGIEPKIGKRAQKEEETGGMMGLGTEERDNLMMCNDSKLFYYSFLLATNIYFPSLRAKIDK